MSPDSFSNFMTIDLSFLFSQTNEKHGSELLEVFVFYSSPLILSGHSLLSPTVSVLLNYDSSLSIFSSVQILIGLVSSVQHLIGTQPWTDAALSVFL